MAHELEVFEDGTTAFFSNRVKPWHALGVITDGALTAEEALKVAQLDWRVFKSDTPVQVPVLVADGVTMVDVPDRFATYRDHPKLGMQGLGVVGAQYNPIQNSEAFEFLNHIVDEGGAVFETAGSLNGGRQVFMSMRLPQSIYIAGEDIVDMYLIAATSHDGSKAFTAAVTPVRPVCQNTVRLALGAAKSTWYMRHTQSATGRIQAAREALGLTFRYQHAYTTAVNELAAASFSDADFNRFLESLVSDSGDLTDRQKANNADIRGEMRALWHAPTQTNIANTRWAALNTVVEWADWAKPVKAKGGDELMVRAERIMTGAVDQVKDRAYQLLKV